jgi:hypothetical protein
MRASLLKESKSIREKFSSGSSNASSGLKKSSPESSTVESSINIEDGLKMSDLAGTREPDMSRVLNQYALASDLWHYSTMDWGRRCEFAIFIVAFWLANR